MEHGDFTLKDSLNGLSEIRQDRTGDDAPGKAATGDETPGGQAKSPLHDWNIQFVEGKLALRGPGQFDLNY